MDSLIRAFDASRDLSAKSALFAEMLEIARFEPLRADALLAENGEGAAVAAIAIEKRSPSIPTKFRVRRIVDLTKSRNYVVCSAAMDLLCCMLVSGKLDDFEKSAIRQHASQMSNHKDIFGTIKARWLSQIAFESNMISRESFVAGVSGAFAANAYHHGYCDPNIRGLKTFLEIVASNGGAFRTAEFEEKMQSLVFLFGSPSASLKYAFVGFSHAKFQAAYSSSLIRSIAPAHSAESTIAIANAIRFALRTFDVPFDEAHFLKEVSSELSHAAAEQVRALAERGPVEACVVRALAAFCKAPTSFEKAMQKCEDSSVAATVAGTLVCCKTARAYSESAPWNGNNIYDQMRARACEFFELANACKIFCA